MFAFHRRRAQQALRPKCGITDAAYRECSESTDESKSDNSTQPAESDSFSFDNQFRRDMVYATNREVSAFAPDSSINH